jgi:hypothetical protein
MFLNQPTQSNRAAASAFKFLIPRPTAAPVERFFMRRCAANNRNHQQMQIRLLHPYSVKIKSWL